MEWSGTDCISANVSKDQGPDQGEQAAEVSGPASATRWTLPEYFREELSSPSEILFDTPKDAWSNLTSTINGVVLPLVCQPVVVQQTPQVPEIAIAPVTSENTSANVPIHQKYSERIDMPNPLLPSDLASAPPTFSQDPVSPVSSFHLQEGPQRMLHSPATIVEDTSVSAPLYQPLLHLDYNSVAPVSAQVECVHSLPLSHSLIAPVSFSYGDHDYMRSSSQYRLPDARNDDNAHEVPSETGQAAGDILRENPGSSHVSLSSDSTSGGYRQLVGSPAITKASTARRLGRGGARQARLYFCEVPRCTSQGFTAKHNLRCEIVILLMATVVLTVVL
ncbi:hypothetical protein PQX77_011684 [Marasmius sp. AFHP31]|nr:hypothetical protein PQX77_011684 [Marasmius sp. AFHP31]